MLPVQGTSTVDYKEKKTGFQMTFGHITTITEIGSSGSRLYSLGRLRPQRPPLQLNRSMDNNGVDELRERERESRETEREEKEREKLTSSMVVLRSFLRRRSWPVTGGGDGRMGKEARMEVVELMETLLLSFQAIKAHEMRQGRDEESGETGIWDGASIYLN
ncbi:hypothetical protein Sjap_015367 [Stephania japonica]|uniref:Uncharacterized protein n=1 Tax=Stephania japonica TaxID=461633 RepID=A0AAP0IJF9_9MAGN